MFNWLTKSCASMPFYSSVSSFMWSLLKLCLPNLHSLIRKQPLLTARLAPHLLWISTHSCFPMAQHKQRGTERNMQNFAPGEVTHALPCLSTQNFSPPNPPMTPSANMDFPFWRLPKPSPRGCSALSWRKGGWEMRCRTPRHMHKYFCVSA